MSLKLAVVIVVVALAGQGFAWPRSQVEPSEENLVSYSLRGASPFVQTNKGVLDGIKHCWNTLAQIMKQVKNQVTLFFKASTLKFTLLGRVSKCFFQKDIQVTYECGSTAFNNYRADANQIEEDQTLSRNILSELVKGFPKCLNGPQDAYPLP